MASNDSPVAHDVSSSQRPSFVPGSGAWGKRLTSLLTCRHRGRMFFQAWGYRQPVHQVTHGRQPVHQVAYVNLCDGYGDI
jgi:hypothetical protein